jgi:hypothetical protein
LQGAEGWSVGNNKPPLYPATTEEKHADGSAADLLTRNAEPQDQKQMLADAPQATGRRSAIFNAAAARGGILSSPVAWPNTVSAAMTTEEDYERQQKFVVLQNLQSHALIEIHNNGSTSLTRLRKTRASKFRFFSFCFITLAKIDEGLSIILLSRRYQKNCCHKFFR